MSDEKSNGDSNKQSDTNTDEKDIETKTEISEEDEVEFLNKKFGEYIPKTIVYMSVGIFTAISSVIGAVLAMGFISGLFCGIEIFNIVQNPETLTGEENVLGFLRSEIETCMVHNATSALGILSALLGGIIGAYPGYKIGMWAKKGLNIRAYL